jgi:hypothetical protein
MRTLSRLSRGECLQPRDHFILEYPDYDPAVFRLPFSSRIVADLPALAHRTRT